MSAAEIVNKVWNYDHDLRDDGVGHEDYVEQITCLIFFIMANEREKGGQSLWLSNRFTRGNGEQLL